MSTSFHAPPQGGTVGQYLTALRIHWLKIAVICVVAVLAATIYAVTATKKYEAEADLQVQPLPTYSSDPFQGFSVFRQAADGSSPVVVAARTMQSRQILDETYSRLGAAGADVSLAVTPLAQADIVAVTATAPNAQRAARAANTYAETIIDTRNVLFQRQLRQRLQQIATQIGTIPKASRSSAPSYPTLAGQLGTLKSYVGASDPTVQLLTPASPPGAASWPRTKLSITVAALLALLLGCALAIGIELLNARVGREEELTLSHRLPILARIPRLPTRLVRSYMSGHALLPGEAWTSYRTLRAVLSSADPDGSRAKSIFVTSACPGDGKTLTAVNLAIAFAAGGQKVILVDGDFHRPMIASVFNVALRRNGLLQVLFGEAKVDQAVMPAPMHPGLSLLLSSREPIDKLDLLDTERARMLLENLEAMCDIVVIDSPPIPEVAEALALAEAVDAVIVCVRLGTTRRAKLAELRDLLVRRRVSPLGFVVTTRERARPNSSSAYSYAEPLKTTSVAGGRPHVLIDRLDLARARKK